MYILRIPGRKPDYTLTEQLHVTFYRRRKATGRVIGGLFREVEDAGVDKNVLQVFPSTRQEPKPTSSRGRTPQSYWHVFRRRLDEMTKHVRVLSDVDIDRIEAVDADIQALQERIVNLREKRHQIVQNAWRNAKKADLAELTAQAEERAENKGRLRDEVTA